MNEIRVSLLAAIKKDRNMFIRAKIDPMFDNVRPQVDALLEDTLQKTKVNAGKEISDVEFALHRMEKWFDGGCASSDDAQKYKSIHNKISDAKGKFKTQSYFGYDDALQIASDAKEVISNVRTSVRNDAISSENGIKIMKTEFENIPSKIEDVKRKKSNARWKGFLILLGGVLVVWFLLSGLVSDETHPVTRIVFLLVLIGAAAPLFWILVVGFFMFVTPSGEGQEDPDSMIKKLKTGQKELREQIITLECRVIAAEESLL